MATMTTITSVRCARRTLVIAWRATQDAMREWQKAMDAYDRVATHRSATVRGRAANAVAVAERALDAARDRERMAEDALAEAERAATLEQEAGDGG